MIATINTPQGKITGVYEGGAYIDLHFGESYAGPAFEVINVWDYATDKPTIECTPAAVRAEMREWVASAGESFAHDMANYREATR